MLLRETAKVRIRMAGTMALKPLGMQAIASLKVMTRRAQQVDDGEDQRNERAPGQAHEGVGIAEGCR